MSLDVPAAVAATLEARSARVAHGHREGGPLGSPMGEALGVGDFERRRVSLHDRRFEITSIWDGDTRYVAGEEGWTRNHDDWPLNHPLWPVDPRLDWGAGLERTGKRQRHGATLEQHRGTVRVPAWRAPGWFYRVFRRSPEDEPPQVMSVEVCTDGHGRIRLASASPQYPDLSELDPRLFRGFEFVFGSREHPRWNTVEFWRFGVDAEIAVPGEDEIVPVFRWRDVKIVGELAGEAWRHRAAIRDFFRR